MSDSPRATSRRPRVKSPANQISSIAHAQVAEGFAIHFSFFHVLSPNILKYPLVSTMFVNNFAYFTYYGHSDLDLGVF